MAKQIKQPQTEPTGTSLAKDVNVAQKERGNFFSNQSVGDIALQDGTTPVPEVDKTKLPASTTKTEGESKAPTELAIPRIEALVKSGVKADVIPDEDKGLGIDISSDQLRQANKNINQGVKKFTLENADKLPEVKAFAPSNTGTPVPENLRKLELDYASQHPEVLKAYGEDEKSDLSLQKKIAGKIVDPSQASEIDKKAYIELNGLSGVKSSTSTKLYDNVTNGVISSDFLYDVAQKTKAYQKEITSTKVFDKARDLTKEGTALQDFFKSTIEPQRKALNETDEAKQYIQSENERVKLYGDLKEDKSKLLLSDNKLADDDTEFQTWYKENTLEGKNDVPYSDKLDYDYYSLFKNGVTGDIENHFPDTYKRPNHSTFSVESLYSTDENMGGYWKEDNYINPDNLKAAVLAKFKEYETDKNELKYKKDSESYNKKVKELPTLLDKSFLVQLVEEKGEAAVNNPLVVQDAIVKAVNQFKYTELSKAGYVPKLSDNEKPEFKELITSQVFQYGDFDDKKILLNEYYSEHKPKDLTRQAFFDRAKRYITEPLDIILIKAKALELQLQSKVRKAVNGIPYKTPDSKNPYLTPESDWTGVLTKSPEQLNADISDVLLDRIAKLNSKDYGILKDFCHGLKDSESKSWVPVIGGLLSAHEQQMVYDAYIAVQNNIDTPEQKRLYETVSAFNTLVQKYKPTLSYTVGKDMTPMLVKFMGEMALIGGISKGISLSLSETETVEWIGKQFLKASTKVLSKSATPEEIAKFAITLKNTSAYIPGQILKIVIGSNTVTVGDVVASTFQKVTAHTESKLDENLQAHGFEVQKAQFQDWNKAFIKSSLQQYNFVGMSNYHKPLDYLLGKTFAGLSARFKSALKYSPMTKRLIQMSDDATVFEVNTTSAILQKAKELSMYIALKGLTPQVAHLGSMPSQWWAFVMVDHVNNTIDDAFGNERSVNMSEDGYLKHKLMETVAMMMPIYAGQTIANGIGITFRSFQKARTEQFKLDDVDLEFVLDMDNVKQNSLFPFASHKRTNLIAYQSIIREIIKHKGNLHENDAKLTQLSNEIDKLVANREVKLARLAEALLAKRVAFDFENENPALTYEHHVRTIDKQAEIVRALITGSTNEGFLDEQALVTARETVTDERLNDEINHLELSSIEYNRQREQKLIPDNITFKDFYIKEQKKLDRIVSYLTDYIANGTPVNFKQIDEMIGNTVMSTQKLEDITALKNQAQDIFIKNQNVRVEHIIFTEEGIKSAYTDVRIEDVQARIEEAQKHANTPLFAPKDISIRITKGLQDTKGNDMDVRVSKDGVVHLHEDTVPQDFINFVVSEYSHMPEAARNNIMFSLSRNESLNFEQKSDLLSRIHRRIAEDLGDNKLKLRPAITMMADLNQALKDLGITYAVNEVGAVPTDGILAYAFFKGNFNYDSEARKFFLTQEEWHKASSLLQAMKKYDNLISGSKIASLENRLITDSAYVYDFTEEDVEDLQVAQQQGYKVSQTKVSKKEIIEYLSELRNNKNLSRGEFNSFVQMISNVVRNMVRMEIADTEYEALGMLPEIKQLQVYMKEGNKKLTNPDILLQDEAVKQEFGGFLNHTYSRLEDAINLTKIKSGTGAEWLKAIEKAGADSGKGFSKDEMKWTGLEKLLTDLDTKQVDSDGVTTFEPFKMDKEQLLKHFRKGLDKIKPSIKILEENKLDIDKYRTPNYNRGSQWDYVTQIGGEGYKEHIFYIGNVEPFAEYDTTHFGDKTEGQGALFWVRSSEHTNENGEKVMFIEEIQSNRNQKLSKTIAENKVIEDSKTGKNELKIYNEKDPKANSFGGKLNFYFELPETGKAIVLDNKKRGVICAAARFIYKNENPDNKSNTANEYQKNELDYQDNDTRIDYLKKALDEHLKNNNEVIGELSNQFEGNNWKNLAGKYIAHYAIQHGIDKIEITGSKTQVKRGGEESGHVQFYDKTMPDIFKKLGLTQGETKEISVNDGVNEVFFYVNGEKITEENTSGQSVVDTIIKARDENYGKNDFNDLTSEEKQEDLKNILVYKNKAKDLYDKKIERAKLALEREISKNEEYGINNEESSIIEAWNNTISALKHEKDLIDTIENIERKADEGKKVGNTHTFEITDKTKTNLERGIALFQKTQQSKDVLNSLVLSEAKSLMVKNKIEGKLFNEKEAEEYQKLIESKYTTGQPKFGAANKDIRQNMWNYDHPVAEKDVNGVNLRIAEGLEEIDEASGKKRKSYLLYADGKVVGKFYHVSDIKSVVKFIEENLIKNLEQKEQTSVKGVFNPIENIILVLKNGDASTIAHELGHSFRFLLQRSADSGNVIAEHKLKVFDDFVNGKEGKRWAVENGIETTDKYLYENELFARAFERYLADGSYSGIKDGNFRNLLQDFKDFLKAIYTDIKSGILNITLNNEMRDMFESIIGNKIDIDKDLMSYIQGKFGRFSKRTNVTKEDMMALLDEAEKRTDPENRAQAMQMLHKIFQQYKNQYIAQRYKGNSRLINPSLRKIIDTPRHNVIEMYRKDVKNFEEIISNARYKYTFQQMITTRQKAIQRFIQNKTENRDFWQKIRELANIDYHSIDSQASMENYIKILKLKPEDTGANQLEAMAEKYIDASNEYKVSKTVGELNKETEEINNAQVNGIEESERQEVSNQGLDETRQARIDQIKSTREYAVNIGDVKMTNGGLVSDFFSLPISDLTDSELNQYNGLLTQAIRAGNKFNFSNEFVQFTTDVKVRQADEMIENALSRHWVDKMARLNNRYVNNISILRHATSRLLNPFGYGLAENYTLKDYLNFFDGIQNDYSGNFVRTVFSPVEEAHDKHRAIINEVFTKINKFRTGDDSIKEGAFNAIGIHWLLNQKPDVKLTDEFFNRETNPETGETKSLIEELGLNPEEMNALRGMTLSADEFFEKDNNGVWKKKEFIDEIRFNAYNKILENRMTYLKESIMITYGEKPDWMSEAEMENHLKQQMSNPLFLIENLHLVKDNNIPNFIKDFWSPVLHKRKLLLDATGAKSVRELVDKSMNGTLDAKNQEFYNIAVSTFDQLNNGEFSDGITMKDMSDNYTATNSNPYIGIKNYAPVIRNVTTSIDNSMALETVPGAISDADGHWGIRTGINLSNQFIKTRSEMVSTLETNAFNMIEKRFDQELFYMLHEPHRLFLKGLLNKKDGVFDNIDRRIDKDGNESHIDENQRSANYIKNMISLYYRRGMSPAKLNLKNSPIVNGLQQVMQDTRVVMLAPMRSSLAQITSTVMSQENMFGGIDTRLKHMSQGYADLFSDSDTKTEFLRVNAPEVYHRGLSDYDLGANKEGTNIGSLTNRYFSNDFDSEEGALSGFIQSLKNNKIATEKALMPMVYFDRAAARATFYASYRNYCEHYGIEVDWNNADKDAVDHAVSVVRKTQNTDNPLYKPGVIQGLSSQQGGIGFFEPSKEKDGMRAMGEVMRQQYWNFKSFSLADQNNIAIKFIQALHDEKTDPMKVLDSVTSIGYNLAGKMAYQYFKSASKAFMVGLGMNIAYLQGMGYLGDGDDDSLLKELIKGDFDWAKNKINLAKNKAKNNAKQIWEDEISAPESHSDPYIEGAVYNATKAMMSEFQVNEMSGTIMANLMKGISELSLDDNEALSDRMDKMYSLSDEADITGLLSNVTGVSLVYGAGKGTNQSEIGNIKNVISNLVNKTPEDITYNDMSSVAFFVSQLLGFRLFGRYPLSYPSIKRWLQDVDKFNKEGQEERGSSETTPEEDTVETKEQETDISHD